MPKKPLALLDRYDLVQLVCELENTVRKREYRIKELEQDGIVIQDVAAFKDSVIKALDGSRDYAGHLPSELNYLQCIRRLKTRVKELERILSPGWGAWKFKEEGDE